MASSSSSDPFLQLAVYDTPTKGRREQPEPQEKPSSPLVESAAPTERPWTRSMGTPPGQTPTPMPLHKARGHYDRLGVPRGATAAEIRRGYRQQALRTHPDKGGDPEDFRSIMDSFEILADQAKRAAYDQELDRQLCLDGQSVEEFAPSEQPDLPADDGRAARGHARCELLELFAEPEHSWSVHLRSLNLVVLEALSSILEEWSQKSRRTCGRKEEKNPAEYPKEHQAPDGFPPGWKKIEMMYKSGKGGARGSTYVRYRSPWGVQFSSAQEALKADADRNGYEFDQPSFEQRQQRQRRRARADDVGEAAGVTRTMQRNIYSQRWSDGPRYWVQVSWSFLRVRTQTTPSLEQAVDWHIAMHAARAAALQRMRAYTGSDASAPLLPMTTDEYLQLLQAEPEIHVTFGSCFCKSGHRNIYTPATDSFEVAMRVHERFTALLAQDPSKHQIQQARAEASRDTHASAEASSGLKFQLAQAVNHEIAARASLGSFVEVCRVQGDGEPRVLRRSARLEARRGSSLDVRTPRQPRLPSQCPPSHSSSSSCSGEAKRRRKGCASAALELQAAMGLSLEAALVVCERVKLLPRPELKRRIQMLMAPEDSWDATRLPAMRASRHVRSKWRRRLALTSAQPAGPKALEAGEPGPGALALSWPSTAARHTEAAWLPQLPSHVNILEWLKIGELGCLRPVCMPALRAASAEMHERFKDFTYEAGCLQPKPLHTRRGRQKVTPSGADGTEEAGRLVEVFSLPTHSHLFERLDLSQVPIMALENTKLQESLGNMSRLEHVVMPTDGWGTSTARTRFLRALPCGTSYQCIDTRGSVRMHGICGAIAESR